VRRRWLRLRLRLRLRLLVALGGFGLFVCLFGCLSGFLFFSLMLKLSPFLSIFLSSSLVFLSSCPSCLACLSSCLPNRPPKGVQPHVATRFNRKDPDGFPAFFALPSSSLAFWRKKRKKEFPSSSFLSSPMGKSRQSQRCFLCNSGEKDLRDTDQQYQGPELATLTHHEDRKACRSCQVFTVLHIKVTLSPPLQFLQPSAFDR